MNETHNKVLQYSKIGVKYQNGVLLPIILRQDYIEKGPLWVMVKKRANRSEEIVASTNFYDKGVVPCVPLGGWHISHKVIHS